MNAAPEFHYLPAPACAPPLDPGFRPGVLAHLAFQEAVRAAGDPQPLVITIQRGPRSISRYETEIFPDSHPESGQNLFYAERLLKFLLWQRGGWRVAIGGSDVVAEHLGAVYAPDGARAFDHEFMGRVYGRPFTIAAAPIQDLPAAQERALKLGGHLEGQRIGFDLGASDLKVSAVADGETVFSAEIEWHPSEQSDPAYHRQKIRAALNLAAARLTRVDAIGGSSAGVYVDNRPMVASLFRGVPEDAFDQVRNLFLELQREMGVPLVVLNDGEVTALAGAMALEQTGVLGIAMGSSEAAGFFTPKGEITDWLNELAFAPLDYSPHAPLDEWSGDRGNGALYLSQQCVFRLAERVGIRLPNDVSNAQKLVFVQERLESGHEGAAQIWQSIGAYLGYAIAHHASFYDFRHVLVLGRVTSGLGGSLVLSGAEKVLATEFPELAARIQVHLPDETIRRVGQSIAAASLPELEGRP
jgi:predicted NBD/HSP70 family sugar kinase